MQSAEPAMPTSEPAAAPLLSVWRSCGRHLLFRPGFGLLPEI
jgi:hypothetical protein